MIEANGPVDATGQQLGSYSITRKIGQGAMGSIYLATDIRDGKRVAVKIPNVESSDHESLLRRFRREAQAAENIRHAHVCRVYETSGDSKPLYYAMEWIEGVTLREWLGHHARLDIAHAVALMIRLAQALQAAHDVGILHRDLKPDNVMMRGDDDPVIVDFGLARWFDRVGQSLLTVEGSIVGSPAYMSPEQILADGQTIGPPADVYSLGILLYELLTGHPPFEGDGIAVLFKAAHETPPPPSQLREDIDPTLDAIIQKALAKDPQERFASAAEFGETLERYSKGEPVELANVRRDSTPPAELPETNSSSSRGLRGILKKFWR